MITQIEAMKLALMYLEEYKYAESRAALRKAIEAAEKCEPVENMYQVIGTNILKDQKYQDGYFIAYGDEDRICEMFYKQLRYHFSPPSAEIEPDCYAKMICGREEFDSCPVRYACGKAFTNRHPCMTEPKPSAEIEELERQLADKHQLFMCASANYDRLAEQLAECQRELKNVPDIRVQEAAIVGENMILIRQAADLRAACQMALDALESCINDPKMRHTDTVHYATQDAIAKLREVLK